MRSESNDFAKVAARVTKAMEPLQSEQLRQALREMPVRLQQQAERLAAHGWTIPLYATPREVDDILRMKTGEGVDQFFVSYYIEQEGANFDRLQQDVLKYERLTKWRPLLVQCFSAYRKQEYLIAVPALLSVMEGVIFTLSQSKGKVYLETVLANKARQAPDGSVLRALWQSSLEFVKHIFRPHDFQRERPSTINRHWILHGRDIPDWGQADNLRLFQGLHLLGRAKTV